MGNRFAELPQYHILIRGHGVIAAITFLFIVPSAILIKRFGPNLRLSVRVHIWLQILTVLLTTVVFALGWFAVGPSRSLTNPHHGIGLAIYVMVLAQFIGGWWVHSRQKKHRSLSEPIKAMVRFFSSEIGKVVANRYKAASLARPCRCTSRTCTDSFGTYPLRISEGLICIIRLSGFCPCHTLLHPQLPPRPAWW